MIFLGFIVVMVGSVVTSGGPASSGVFILIGPVPIVFGNGPNSAMLALAGLAITLAVVLVYLMSFLRWRSRR